MGTVVEVNNLKKSYFSSNNAEKGREISVLKGLSFEVKEGEFLGIMGRSGCGKTTLLKTLGMIESPTDGKLQLCNNDVSDMKKHERADFRRNNLGFIFQDYQLMNSLKVCDNIALPLILDKKKGTKIADEVEKYAKEFQVDQLLKKFPYELSGGEKQRVAICRALIHNPGLILADEPTGNLDSKSGKIVMDALLRIHDSHQKTIVMVTHDPLMASFCDRIIFLKDGEIKDEFLKSDNRQEFYQRILTEMEYL